MVESPLPKQRKERKEGGAKARPSRPQEGSELNLQSLNVAF